MYLNRVLLVVLFFICFWSLNGQVVLQIERFNEHSPEKYYVGSYLEYRLKQFPKEWMKNRIEEIKDKEKMIVFMDGSYILMDDIFMIRKRKPSMNALSKTLYGFGLGWFVYGGIASLTTDFKPDWGTVGIGGGALFMGWIFRLFYYQKTKINKRNRLRIIDISWPDAIRN